MTVYNKQGLPSNGVFGISDVNIRPMQVKDLQLAYRARVEDNITHIIDLVDGCIKEDARDLTVPDFYYLCAWLRLNSYPVTPLSLKWECKNKHENTDIVSTTNLSITVCDKSKAGKYADVELHYATVRDLEYINEVKAELPEHEAWLLDKAQWLSPKLGDITKRVELLKEGGIEDDMALLGSISTFRADMRHGVAESVKLCCEKEECAYHSGVEVLIPMKLVEFFPFNF